MTNQPPASVTIGDLTFDRIRYSEWVGDLFLKRGTKRPLIERQLEPLDGHVVGIDEDGDVVQYILFYPDLFIERDGELRFHLPSGTVALTPEEAAPLLVDPNAERDARRRRREALIERITLGDRIRLPRRLRERRMRRRRAASDARRAAAGS